MGIRFKTLMLQALKLYMFRHYPFLIGHTKLNYTRNVYGKLHKITIQFNTACLFTGKLDFFVISLLKLVNDNITISLFQGGGKQCV